MYTHLMSGKCVSGVIKNNGVTDSLTLKTYRLFLTLIIGNLILNWPKLLQHFKTRFFTLYRCVCVRNVILHDFWYNEVRLKK